jgi:integrase
MARINLTDRFIKSRKAAPLGKRNEFPDAIVPGLYLRVTDRGHKSFALVARYPLYPLHPTRRALGDCGALTLAEARQKAREWLQLIARGVDPQIAEERQRAAQLRRQANTFAAVAADFIERHAKKLAKADDAETVIEREFTSRWGPRPITDVTAHEVSAAIRAIVKRGAPYQAHNAFGYIRRLFNWAIATGEYGVETSPVERLKPGELIGKREARKRVLDDAELEWVWEATGELGYPYAPLIRMLMLTGQRKSEVAEMRWCEVDFGKALWTIPAERMKGDAAHVVPLPPTAVELLKSVPTWEAGEFVFTTTQGKTPVNGFSKAKARIDGRIAKLRQKAIGAKAAEKAAMRSWVLHDLRRTMRTHLSALPVQDLVRELVIAHAKPGLHRVYDQFAYLEEKRQALELWAKRLALIVSPPAPTSVVSAAVAREGQPVELESDRRG